MWLLYKTPCELHTHGNNMLEMVALMKKIVTAIRFQFLFTAYGSIPKHEYAPFPMGLPHPFGLSFKGMKPGASHAWYPSNLVPKTKNLCSLWCSTLGHASWSNSQNTERKCIRDFKLKNTWVPNIVTRFGRSSNLSNRPNYSR